MRRKVTLYVGGRKADLADTSFLLMNYTAEDLSNPTIVKNSFSQQVTLPGTCRNNSIFGAIWRTDRISGGGGSTGPDFAPSRRTPFALYDASGEVLAQGYLKLDEVVRKGPFCREYKVTLYGILGDFFYNLSYNVDGTKKTLADLDYMGGGEDELGFTINAATVQEAWDAKDNDTPGKWQVINFMPAYEGTPENFSADKGLIAPALGGLQDNVPLDGETYTTRSGFPYTLVSLPQAVDEWAAKDLRSYLQRPVVNMKAVMEAIAKPENNGGYEFDFSGVRACGVYLRNLWKTLPLISSLGTFKETTGGLTYQFSSTPGGTMPAAVFIDGVSSLPAGSKITVGMSLSLSAALANHGTLGMSRFSPTSYYLSGDNCVMFVQAVGYDSSLNPIAASKIRVVRDPFYGSLDVAPDTLAEWCGYTKQYEADYDETVTGTWSYSGGRYVFSNPINLSVEGYDITQIYVYVRAYNIEHMMISEGQITKESVTDLSGAPRLYSQAQNDYWTTTDNAVGESSATTVRATSAAGLRSGAYISKRLLLSTDKTPAEYLISMAKMFGWLFVTDPATKKVTVMQRNDFYQDETVDLSRRVDTSQDVIVSPFAFTARWYDFRQPSAGGAFADEYKGVEGREYGIQRVNTGYEFDTNTVDLLSGSAFKSAVTVLESSRYWNIITEGGVVRPSPFVDAGGKYTLWTASGKAHDFDVNQPTLSSTIVYYNSAFDGYDADLARKMQFHAADGKPVDGSDVLVFSEGWETYQYFKLTDDLPAMDILNDGKPCWLLEAGSADGIRVPIFQRYTYRHDWIIDSSLDFGVPAQISIPGAIYDAESTIYVKAWKNYMADRYDKDTKVMTCKVDLSGLQVGQNLLRKFYFYDGSLWALNKITNHSLTTYGPTECEFVQVHDKNNYLNGQE